MIQKVIQYFKNFIIIYFWYLSICLFIYLLTHFILFWFSSAVQVFKYTDDTAMTRSVAESLLISKNFDATDLAKRFTLEYFRSPDRGYGANVAAVFCALKLEDFNEPFGPAKRQFHGTGSYGNGAAMRIAPAAMYGFNFSDHNLAKLSQNCSLITHYHPHGFNGAVFQTFAVHQALHLNENFDVLSFLDKMISKMNLVESEFDGDQKCYTNQLKTMKEMIQAKNGKLSASVEEIVETFGNRVSAPKSVASALYSAFKAHEPMEIFENIFVKALYAAISLGGDTDTIASMTCSIVGAMYGESVIPEIFIKRCEASDIMTKLADELFNRLEETDNNQKTL